MNRKTPPTQKTIPESGKRGLVLLLSFLILACLVAAAFLIFNSRKESKSPVGFSPSAGHPNFFYLPGDFEPQETIILAGDQLADQDPEILVQLLRSLQGTTKVRLITSSSNGGSKVPGFLNAHGLSEFDFLNVPMGSVGIRDYCPFTVSDSLGHRSMVNFPSRNRHGNPVDDGFPDVLAVKMGLNVMGSRLYLEGGDLLSNGQGFGLVSTSVIKGNAPNQEMDTKDIIQNIASLLGFENLILVPQLEGESSGHVDMFCAFLDPDLVVVGSYEPAIDAVNADNLDRTAEVLENLTTMVGPLRVERLPMPDHDDGVWRTYTNILMANEIILVPLYPDYCPDLDQQVLATYRRLLPTRRIVGINVSDLTLSNGGLRGISLNIPTGLRQ
jgi:agmatine deiminase